MDEDFFPYQQPRTQLPREDDFATETDAMTYTQARQNETRQLLDQIKTQRAALRPFGAPFVAKPAISQPAPAPTRSPSPKQVNTTAVASSTKAREPNITERTGRDGKRSWRVQIRSRINGGTQSLSKTFQSLANAKKWRNKKLAEIELHGFTVKISGGKTVAGVIADRLAGTNQLGRFARQVLTFLENHDIGKVHVIDLTKEKLIDLALELSADNRTAQTVAGYMTMLTSRWRPAWWCRFWLGWSPTICR